MTKDKFDKHTLDWYDSEQTMICVEFSDADLDNLLTMRGNKYAVFPDDCEMTRDQMLEWME